MYKLSEGIGDSAEMYFGMAPYQMRKKIFYPEWEKIKEEYRKEEKKKNLNQFLSYLRRKGYIEVPEGKSLREGFKLTKKGRIKAIEGIEGDKKKEKRKDGKMILLMYDIPERKRKLRNIFRNTLISLDYQLLQKSIWVSDKEVLRETEIAIDNIGINNYVNIFLINNIKVHK